MEHTDSSCADSARKDSSSTDCDSDSAHTASPSSDSDSPPTLSTLSASVAEATAQIAAAIESYLAAHLATPDPQQAPLWDALRHAAIGGGKYLRPLLVAASAQIFHIKPAATIRIGAAIEAIHCYSLIHDDLPCMDNADLRRGRATLHRAYDEATAVLAGDALQALAFAWLADPATHRDPHIRLALIASLAQAAGPHGMVGGQAMDIRAEQAHYDLPTTTHMQRLKTGALIGCAVEAGAILGGGGATSDIHDRLRAYATHIGLAFQITDDIIDASGDVTLAGKVLGRDSAAGKATYVAQLGVEGAQTQAKQTIDEALAALDIFASEADLLRSIARYIRDRKH